MDINYDEMLQSSTQEMHDADDALIESGFSQEQ
jgi:hypothetical protein